MEGKGGREARRDGEGGGGRDLRGRWRRAQTRRRHRGSGPAIILISSSLARLSSRRPLGSRQTHQQNPLGPSRKQTDLEALALDAAAESCGEEGARPDLLVLCITERLLPAVRRPVAIARDSVPDAAHLRAHLQQGGRTASARSCSRQPRAHSTESDSAPTQGAAVEMETSACTDLGQAARGLRVDARRCERALRGCGGVPAGQPRERWVRRRVLVRWQKLRTSNTPQRQRGRQSVTRQGAASESPRERRISSAAAYCACAQTAASCSIAPRSMQHPEPPTQRHSPACNTQNSSHSAAQPRQQM